MKITLPVKEEHFNVVPNKFCGLDCYLITPEINAKWSKHNLFYRSLVTDKEGNVLSCGWPKFFNTGEQVCNYPDPNSYKDWVIQDKIDGSLLIADFINGQFSMRTRGCVSYITQNNATDFELLPQKYPKVVEFLKENTHITLLFEIVTPNNVIVVRPEQIEFYLLGAINKNGLCVVTTHDLTNIWRKIGCVSMPQMYQFDNITDLSAIVSLVKNWKGKEGVVISYNKNQNRIKLKSDWYCFIHRIKSQLNSENNLIEYYVSCGMPKYENFYKKIEQEFDYELAQQLIPQISKICDASVRVENIIKGMKEFVYSIRNFETRKQQAEHIIASYGKTNRASFVFHILNGKELTNEQKVKLIHQTL